MGPEFIKELRENVSGLEDWDLTYNSENKSILFQVYKDELNYETENTLRHDFNPFSSIETVIDISESPLGDEDYHVSSNWMLGSGHKQYKRKTALFKHIQKLVSRANRDIDIAYGHFNNFIADISATKESIKPLEAEWGKVFNITTRGMIRLKNKDFPLAVDVEREAVRLHDGYIPLHLMLPVLKEVELHKLLDA